MSFIVQKKEIIGFVSASSSLRLLYLCEASTSKCGRGCAVLPCWMHSMKETTPSPYRCASGFCPATFDLEDGRVLIIGKKAPSPLLNEIAGRVGEDEYAIVVDAAMLENVVPK